MPKVGRKTNATTSNINADNTSVYYSQSIDAKYKKLYLSRKITWRSGTINKKVPKIGTFLFSK